MSTTLLLYWLGLNPKTKQLQLVIIFSIQRLNFLVKKLESEDNGH